MATTENKYTGDGSTTRYSIQFEYLNESDIKVSLQEPGQAAQTTTAFTFANATTIQLNSPPTAGYEVRIFRETSNDTLISKFFAGSAIRAVDLNKNFEQTLFSVQEVLARFIDRTQAIFQNNVDLSGFKIVNLGDGTDDADAVNKSQLDATQNYNDTQLAASVTEATNQASTATTKAGEANQSAIDANASASAASLSASAASDSADDAEGFAAAAATSATAAETFAVDPVFFGFKRATPSGRTVLRCEFSAATDTTTLHDPNDFFYKNKVTSFMGSNGLINAQNEPKFSYQSNGHVYIQLHN
jgi:hypothetical protein